MNKMHSTFMQRIIILISTLMLISCASGTAIVTGATRTAITPDKVKLYVQPPEEYEVIAIVKASSDAGWTAQGSQDYAVQELKNQAAQLGANGVLLGSTGTKTSAAIGGYGAGATYAIPVEAEVVSGQAIYVPSK